MLDLHFESECQLLMMDSRRALGSNGVKGRVSPCIAPEDTDFTALSLESIVEQNKNTDCQVSLFGVDL